MKKINNNIKCVDRYNSIRYNSIMEIKTLNEIIGQKSVIDTIKKMDENNIQNMICCGPPGTGKTSTITAFVRERYGDYSNEMTMTINASAERGIDTIRNKIRNFVSTISVGSVGVNIPKYKFIIMDEADAMTQDAQSMLRHIMEFYTHNSRFCLICNCIKKINTAIQSRCILFSFSPLSYDDMLNRLTQISALYNLNIDESGFKTLWKLSCGDMRKLHNIIKILPNDENIDDTIICKYLNYPVEKTIKNIYKILFINDIKKSIEIINSIINTNKFSLNDILNEITVLLIDDLDNEVLSKNVVSYILLNMRTIEINMITSVNINLQINSLISLFYIAMEENKY